MILTIISLSIILLLIVTSHDNAETILGIKSVNGPLMNYDYNKGNLKAKQILLSRNITISDKLREWIKYKSKFAKLMFIVWRIFATLSFIISYISLLCFAVLMWFGLSWYLFLFLTLFIFFYFYFDISRMFFKFVVK